MRFFIAFLTISLVALTSADQGFVLRSYNTYKDYEFGRQYAAIAYKLSVPRGDYYVSGVEATNLQGMTNDNVEALHIVHQSTPYLPRRVLEWYKGVTHYHVIASGVETLEGEPLDGRIRYIHLDGNLIRTIPRTFFSNTKDMELISIARNMLETLDGEMFRGMPKLRWVSFAGNRIRRLPGTLFAANPNIECMSFENNGLTNVGAELVRDLGKLKGVSFDGNACINIAYWSDPNMRTELGREFTTNCGGRCDGMNSAGKDIDHLEDAIKKAEDQYPVCSWSKNHWMVKDNTESHNNSDSSESDESDSNELKKKKYGPNHACPHAHYPKMRN